MSKPESRGPGRAPTPAIRVNAFFRHVGRIGAAIDKFASALQATFKDDNVVMRFASSAWEEGMRGSTCALAVIALASLALGACQEDQQTIEGTRSWTTNVAGKRMKVNLSPTGVPNEYDLLVVRDAVVINPDPDSERERGQEVASRAMREVCNVKRLQPQVIDDRLVSQINYYVRFRCA